MARNTIYKGNTIDDVTGMIDAETEKILQVDPNLLPGYGDVIERVPLYTGILEAHSREITPEMLKEIGIKEIYGKGVGEEITLKELVDKLAKQTLGRHCSTRRSYICS